MSEKIDVSREAVEAILKRGPKEKMFTAHVAEMQIIIRALLDRAERAERDAAIGAFVREKLARTSRRTVAISTREIDAVCGGFHQHRPLRTGTDPTEVTK